MRKKGTNLLLKLPLVGLENVGKGSYSVSYFFTIKIGVFVVREIVIWVCFWVCPFRISGYYSCGFQLALPSPSPYSGQDIT